MRMAVQPLIDIDSELAKQFAAEDADYDQRKAAAKKDGEAFDDEKPVRQTTITDSDFSTEGLQNWNRKPVRRSDFSDEFRAIFDAALQFASNGSNHTGRAFLLKSHNTEWAKTIRAGKEVWGYPSYSMLGSMQPDLLHEVASDVTNNDGMTHRINAIFINKEALPKPTKEAPAVRWFTITIWFMPPISG